MQKLILPLLLTFLCLPEGINGAESELERLRKSYESAVTRAVEPLKNTYEKELRALLQRYAQAGRLDEAAEVMTELKELGVDTQDDASASSQSPKSKRSMIENSKWKTPTGTTFSFEADGKGTRSFNGADITAIEWRQRSGGMVEVTGLGGQGGKSVTWFFRFVTEEEAYYGNNKEGTSTRLERLR